MAGPPALHIFFRQKTGTEKKVFNRLKKLAIEMGNIIEKVADERP